MDKITAFAKEHLFVLLGIVCVIAVGVIYVMTTNRAPAGVVGDYLIYAVSPIASSPAESITLHEVAPEPQVVEPEITAPQTIIVHIAGEVVSPGVFELPYGARINDAVALAGGITTYADLTRINLAAFLVDAMHVVVPTYGVYNEAGVGDLFAQAPATSSSIAVVGIVDGIVNINVATATELQTLSGIGPVLAQNIIDFREQHGGFSNVDELINVSRIGQATLERLRPLVTVG